jgi:hypothetical protein
MAGSAFANWDRQKNSEVGKTLPQKLASEVLLWAPSPKSRLLAITASESATIIETTGKD